MRDSLSKPMTSRPAPVAAALVALLLGGCSLMPVYERPAAPVAEHWPGLAAPQGASWTLECGFAPVTIRGVHMNRINHTGSGRMAGTRAGSGAGSPSVVRLMASRGQAARQARQFPQPKR